VATPIGHGLLGIAVLSLLNRQTTTNTLPWYCFAVFAANAADLDFIPGLLLGDINQYHQGPSHSLFAACLFGVASMLLAPVLKLERITLGMVSTLIYSSHLVLDMFGQDRREPFGIPVGWPLFDDVWKAPYELFHGIQHGQRGDSLYEFLQQVFSLHNVVAIGKEIIIITPILLLTLLWHRKR